MAYRDEGEAAIHRVASLENELATARAEVSALTQALERANAEIVRLAGKPIERALGPIPPMNAKIALGLRRIAGVSIMLLAYGIDKSESLGMSIAHLAPAVRRGIRGVVSASGSTQTCIITAVGWGLATLSALMLFFATIWRSL